MAGDWVKLHRQLLDSQVFQDVALLKVWIWCLLRANWKEVWIPTTSGRGTTQTQLLPGQFICGRNAAAVELKMKPTTVRDRLKKLASMGNLAIQSAGPKSIVTVCNWETYQGLEEDESAGPSAVDPPVNRQSSASEPPQSKKVKKREEGKEQQEKITSEPQGDSEVVLVYPCVGPVKEWGLTRAKVDEYRENFPGLDIRIQCRAALQWCIDNPTKRKTARGMTRFLANWLTRQQNQSRGAAAPVTRSGPAYNTPQVKASFALSAKIHAAKNEGKSQEWIQENIIDKQDDS